MVIRLRSCMIACMISSTPPVYCLGLENGHVVGGVSDLFLNVDSYLWVYHHSITPELLGSLLRPRIRFLAMSDCENSNTINSAHTYHRTVAAAGSAHTMQTQQPKKKAGQFRTQQACPRQAPFRRCGLISKRLHNEIAKKALLTVHYEHEPFSKRSSPPSPQPLLSTAMQLTSKPLARSARESSLSAPERF